MPKITAVADIPIAEPPTKRPTKVGMVRSMLERADGAPMADLAAATGWQPHTIRAVLTGLRKTGAKIAKRERDGPTCYFIAPVV